MGSSFSLARAAFQTCQDVPSRGKAIGHGPAAQADLGHRWGTVVRLVWPDVGPGRNDRIDPVKDFITERHLNAGKVVVEICCILRGPIIAEVTPGCAITKVKALCCRVSPACLSNRNKLLDRVELTFVGHLLAEAFLSAEALCCLAEFGRKLIVGHWENPAPSGRSVSDFKLADARCRAQTQTLDCGVGQAALRQTRTLGRGQEGCRVDHTVGAKIEAFKAAIFSANAPPTASLWIKKVSDKPRNCGGTSMLCSLGWLAELRENKRGH
jgi:hypothetical protein